MFLNEHFTTCRRPDFALVSLGTSSYSPSTLRTDEAPQKPWVARTASDGMPNKIVSPYDIAKSRGAKTEVLRKAIPVK